MKFALGQILALTLLLSSLGFAQTKPATPKKLIEFGWDEPDTAFMRQHIREMEKRPFAGCVYDIFGADAAGQKLRFIEHAWGKRKFTLQELKAPIDDLKATDFRKFTDNFLRFDVTPGDVDWFDDFSSIIENARLAAYVAKNGKATRGLLFDVEPYNKPLWDYRQQRDNKTKSFEQYAAQTRTRGREFMQALQGEYPDITILLTFAYSLAHMQTAGDPAKLPAVDYGLLPAFLDGMIDVAAENVRIIDGHEISYAYKTPAEYDIAVKLMDTDALKLVANPDKYKTHFRKSFGVWMDMDWRKYGWDAKDFSKNYYTPQAFETSVGMALDRCDDYVWIYTEKPKWWVPAAGKPADLPKAYEDALRRASARTQRSTP